MILIDPTGEYKPIHEHNSGEDWHINNSKLQLSDWFALLKPSQKT